MYSQAYWLYDKKYMYVFVLTLAHKIRFLSIFFYKESLKRDKYKFLKYFLSHCMQEIYCSGVIIVCIFLYICKQEMFFSQRIMFRIIEKLVFEKSINIYFLWEPYFLPILNGKEKNYMWYVVALSFEMVTSVLHILKIVVRECCYVYVCASMYNLFIFNSSTNQWMTRIFICFSLLGSSSLEEKKKFTQKYFWLCSKCKFWYFCTFPGCI